jgi:carbamoyl-phosphate synthase large subunit
MPKRTDIKTILIIGSGPIVIGQASEFDYSGVQACKAISALRVTIVLVNSNPGHHHDRSRFRRRDLHRTVDGRDLRAIIEAEKPDALLPTVGGQTALNLALAI